MRKIYLIIVILLFSQLLFSFDWTVDTDADWNSATVNNCSVIRGRVGLIRLTNIDYFDAGCLKEEWIIENGDINNRCSSDTVSFTEHKGYLTLKTSNQFTQWFGGVDTSDKILLPVQPELNFTILTMFSMPTADMNPDASFGLFYRLDSNNMVVCGYHNGIDYTKNLFMAIYENGALKEQKEGYPSLFNTSYNYNIVTGFSPEFLFKKNQAEIVLYTRFKDADPWVRYKSFPNPHYQNAEVGFYIYDGGNNGLVDSKGEMFHIGGLRIGNYLGSLTNTAGTVVSAVHDFGEIPKGTGNIKWDEVLPTIGSEINLFVQTSDDGVTWNSPWSGPYINNNGEIIKSDNRRYIRFKADLVTDNYTVTPFLDKVSIEYVDVTRDISAIRDFKVYPTIAVDKITIRYEQKMKLRKSKISIKQSTGKNLATIFPSTDQSVVSVNEYVKGWVNGVYFVKLEVERDDGVTNTEIRKFVIKK